MKSKIIYTLAIPLFLAVGCGKDSGTNTNPAGPGPTISDVGTITQTPDRRSLVGRKVEVASVGVEEPVRQYVFWAGVNNATVPVVRRDKLNGPVTGHVRKGSIVRMTGTVRLVESIPATDRLWEGIADRPAELNAVKSAVIYIDADSVTVTKF